MAKSIESPLFTNTLQSQGVFHWLLVVSHHCTRSNPAWGKWEISQWLGTVCGFPRVLRSTQKWLVTILPKDGSDNNWNSTISPPFQKRRGRDLIQKHTPPVAGSGLAVGWLGCLESRSPIAQTAVTSRPQTNFYSLHSVNVRRCGPLLSLSPQVYIRAKFVHLLTQVRLSTSVHYSETTMAYNNYYGYEFPNPGQNVFNPVS